MIATLAPEFLDSMAAVRLAKPEPMITPSN